MCHRYVFSLFVSRSVRDCFPDSTPVATLNGYIFEQGHCKSVKTLQMCCTAHDFKKSMLVCEATLTNNKLFSRPLAVAALHAAANGATAMHLNLTTPYENS